MSTEFDPTIPANRFDGVLDYAKGVGLQTTEGEMVLSAVLRSVQSAQVYLAEMPSDEVLLDLGNYCSKRDEEVGEQVRYVDNGKFVPQENTEFDTDFSQAATTLLEFYRTPYFNHNAEGARQCTTMRILEVTDEAYEKHQLLQFGRRMLNVAGLDGLREIAQTDLNNI